LPRNVEIKARVRDWGRQRARADAMASSREELTQTDTFFLCERGLLKLREFGDGSGEIIYYERPRQAGPKTSEYQVLPVRDPAGVREVLSQALGVRKVVRKRRTVFHVGRTRVHFDEVDGLGRFIELEVVLQPGEYEAHGATEATRLMAALDIEEADLLDGAYVDMSG
jgi:predicted adenylyl cyclase CyaB